MIFLLFWDPSSHPAVSIRHVYAYDLILGLSLKYFNPSEKVKEIVSQIAFSLTFRLTSWWYLAYHILCVSLNMKTSVYFQQWIGHLTNFIVTNTDSKNPNQIFFVLEHLQTLKFLAGLYALLFRWVLQTPPSACNRAMDKMWLSGIQRKWPWNIIHPIVCYFLWVLSFQYSRKCIDFFF